MSNFPRKIISQMSLYSKLGPQGRSLLAPNGAAFATGVPGSNPIFSDEPPQELDYLIHSLRNPPKDMNVSKVLGYLYHYLPYVKLDHNLWLVFSSFLNNPTCFGQEAASFEENYTIIEAFKAITDKKLNISQPTLLLKSWYTTILQSMSNFVAFSPHNGWKVLPIIAGMLLSNPLRDDLYSRVNVIEYGWFFDKWDKQAMELFSKALGYTLAEFNPDNVINLALLSLAVTYKKSEDITIYTGLVLPSFMINKLTQLIFSNSPYSLKAYDKLFVWDETVSRETINHEIIFKPVVKHLNRLSFLLESYYDGLPYSKQNFELIMDGLTKIKLFNLALAAKTQNSRFNSPFSIKNSSDLHQQFWFLMKTTFFAECIIAQGILSRFMAADKVGFSLISWFKALYPLEVEYRQIALKMLDVFYNVNHILLSIGQGGFDSFNFVYYLSLELILGSQILTSEFEKVSLCLLGYPNVNMHFEAINLDMVNRSRVLFVLGLWENYLQKNKHNNDFIKASIFPICIDLVRNPGIASYEVIEACHSVLLLCFSNRRANKHLKELMDYMELIISQFPRILSAQQLSIAVESLGKQILSDPVSYEAGLYKNSAEEFLDYVNFKCMNTRSGVRININPSETMFTSAQPIGEIHAESTMKSLNAKEQNVNIIKENKTKKPKDQVKLNILPQTPGKEYEFTNRLNPETSREAMILAFINVVPYLPLSVFLFWLEKILILIESSNHSETVYLKSMFWKVLSENLDLNRCELAYRWWYETKKAVVSPEARL